MDSFDSVEELDIEEDFFDEEEIPFEDELENKLSFVPEEYKEIARKYKSGQELNDNELDKLADTAISIVRELLSFFQAENANIDEFVGSDNELILDINNEDLALLIGRHGRTLDALQYIFNLIYAHEIGFRYPIVLDIEGYKNRRKQKIESIAVRSAQRCKSMNIPIHMHPMKPYERRLVHMVLKNVSGIHTHSEGEEPNRHVVIVPKNR